MESTPSFRYGDYAIIDLVGMEIPERFVQQCTDV